MIRHHSLLALPAIGKALAITLGLTVGAGGVAAMEIWPASLPRLVFASDPDADGPIKIFVAIEPSTACATHQPRWLWLPPLSAQRLPNDEATPERNGGEAGSMAARSPR